MTSVAYYPALKQQAQGFLLTFCLCLALMLFSPLLAWASNWPAVADTVFRHISIEQGLPHPVVTAISQTGDGFIWVGTENGLARWDGYRFRAYRAQSGKANGLPNSSILKLHTDRQGRLWVAMNNGRVVRYDAALDQFIETPLLAGGQLARIYCFFNDPQGGLLIGTSSGLVHVTENGKVRWQRGISQPDKTALGGAVIAIEGDNQGRLWIATRDGLWLQESPQAPMQNIGLSIASDATLHIASFRRLQDGRILAVTTAHGLLVIDPKQTLVTPFPLTAQQQALITLGRFSTLVEAPVGQIWLGSFTQGIMRINLKTGYVDVLRHDPGMPTSVIIDAVNALFVDRSGLLWVGTERGLSLHDPSQAGVLSVFGKPGVPNRMSGMDVRSILALAPDRILLGLSGQGVNLLNPENNTVSPWGGRLANTIVQDMLTLPNGDVYFATEIGLLRTDKQGLHAYDFPFAGRAMRIHSYVLGYFAKRLWLGTADGLWQLDPDLAEPKLERVPGTEALNGFTLRALAWDGKTGLWLGTNSGGLFHFDMSKKKLLPVKLQSTPKGEHFTFIANLLLDPKGRLWIAGQGDGIAVLPDAQRPETAGVQFIGQAQGLHNLMINRFLPDDDGKIWVSTDEGLAQIDPVRMKAGPLRRAEGVNIDTYWVGSGSKTGQGDLLFGGAGGITVVRPRLMQASHAFPQVVASNVQLGGAEHWLGSDLTVQPKANSLTVEFAALDYAAPDRIHYSYRLEGYDNDWINTPVTRRLASYTNLPPGEYRLQLRASNRLGEWGAQSLALPVVVLPHWWQIWWVRLIFTLAALLLFVVLLQGRTSWLRQRQIELEQQVAARTAELNQKQQELLRANQSLNQSNIDLAESMAYLHDAQAKIVQQEKLASIGTLTAGISHEINNPSNFAHVGAYNLGTDLAELREFLLHLAGDEAPPELLNALNQRFEKLHQSLDAVSEGTTRIRDLVRDLRTFSRLGETDWVVATLADSLRATVHLVRTQYAGDIEIKLDLSVNPELLCWPAQLNQVFMNLIVNACQAMMARPDEVRASRPGVLQINTEIEGEFLLISFRDNGPGIKPELIARIFDPFFTTKTVGEGMGMGLAISHGIIEKHRGSIRVQSKLGVGTCFTLHLPLPQA